MTWVRVAVGTVVLCLTPLLVLAPVVEGPAAASTSTSTSTSGPMTTSSAAPWATDGRPRTEALAEDLKAAPARPAALAVTGGPAALQDRVRVLLGQREDAVRRHDRRAFLDTVAASSRTDHDATAPGLRAREDSVFERLRQLRLSTFRYDSATVEPADPPGGGAALEVRGTYALGRYGGPRAFRVWFGLDIPGDGAASSVRLSDPPTSVASAGTAPWQLPGLRVVRGRSSLVLGNVAPQRLRAYARLADDAVRVVDRWWGRDWSRAPVIVAPATTGQYAGLTGQSRSQAAASQVAAVTTGPVDAGGRSLADQVVVRPQTWSQLTPQGRAVVVTHEVTHVATRATTTGDVPLWLSEGLADYVGYRSVALPPSVIAAGLLSRVRAGEGPTRIPGDAAFDTGRHPLAVSYQEGWMLCRHIAVAHGEPALVRFYRAVATGTPTRRAMREVLGVDQEQLTSAWLADLRHLSR